MRTIKIDFSDFWPDFEKENNFFIHLLRRHFVVEISSEPDFLIYSTPGKMHESYTCTKIFYTGESEIPNYAECDYSISFELSENSRNIRFPLYALYGQAEELIKPKLPYSEFRKEEKKFCNMVVSNGSAKERIEFFHKLSKYKKVDSGGRFLNNIGGPVEVKRSFISGYKFSIAFENTSHPGYTTEKIIEPMYSGSMPIYWGNPLVNLDFNTKSFLNWHDYGSDEKLIDRIIELDQDENRYEEVYNQPFFENNQLTKYVDEDRLITFFMDIFSNDFQRNRFYLGRNILSFYYKSRIWLGARKNQVTSLFR